MSSSRDTRGGAGGGRGDRTVFVTVGTTKFDALIRAVDQQAVADALAAVGYTRLVMQIGASGYRPHRLFPPNSRVGRTHAGLAVEYFDYAPSLAQHLSSAALVISHAGSGSLFETLRAGRPLIAVPNPLLMDNHQAELAAKLEEMGVCVAAPPDRLLDAICSFDATALVPYEPGSPAGIVAAIDALAGVGPAAAGGVELVVAGGATARRGAAR